MTQITSTDGRPVPAHSAADRSAVAVVPRAPAAVGAAPPVRAAGAADPAALADAVRQLNEHYATRQTDLHFTVDKTTHETVVAVIDQKSGEVLRQIPSAEALHIARTLSEAAARLIESVA